MRSGRCSHRPAGTSGAAVSKPSGGIRSLLSLSACGLPTPVVALACIDNVDIQVFSCADGEPYFLRRLQAGGGVHPRSITSRAAVSKSSGGIRSLHSLSACGLPTPIVALACIGNVDIQVFSCADSEPYFVWRLQAGGGVHPRSILSRAAVSKPSGGIRSLHSLSAWGLPTPLVALACIGNVDIQVFFWCRWVTLFHTAFASLYF